MRYPFWGLFAAGLVFFLLGLLDLYGLGIPGTDGQVLWRVGVSVLLADMCLMQLLGYRPLASSGSPSKGE